MTPEQIAFQVWAQKYAQQAVELVNVLTDLNLAQQKVKTLELQLAAQKRADDASKENESSKETND